MNFIKSLNKAIGYLNIAAYNLDLAFQEVGKHRHPVHGEISGVLMNVTRKISRLEEIKQWEENKNETS